LQVKSRAILFAGGQKCLMFTLPFDAGGMWAQWMRAADKALIFEIA
jgi:hypothetical protein